MNKTEITKELAMGSILTGQISELHLFNMKMYPFIFLNEIESAEVAYDIVTDLTNSSPGKRTTVSYSLSFKKEPTLKELEVGFEHLQKALSVLFSQNVTLILRDSQGQKLLGQDQ